MELTNKHFTIEIEISPELWEPMKVNRVYGAPPFRSMADVIFQLLETEIWGDAEPDYRFTKGKLTVTEVVEPKPIRRKGRGFTRT